jgi:hypothetical protein
MTTQPSTADLDAARLLLTRLGVSPADLLATVEERAPAPTFAEYVPVVAAAVTDGTRRVYGSYWNRIVEHWGSRPLDEPTPSEIQQLAEHTKTHVVSRRNARGGRSAAEHLIAALRCVYRHAENDKHIAAADNPARKVAKPRRLPSDRRAVPGDRLAEINHIAATTGSDPALDTLILRLHTETAGFRRNQGDVQQADQVSSHLRSNFPSTPGHHQVLQRGPCAAPDRRSRRLRR